MYESVAVILFAFVSVWSLHVHPVPEGFPRGDPVSNSPKSKELKCECECICLFMSVSLVWIPLAPPPTTLSRVGHIADGWIDGILK